MPDAKHLLRHFLAALAYRFQKTVANAPELFPELEAGHGIRTPLAIAHHINGVLGYGRKVLEDNVDTDYRYHHPKLDWMGEVNQVHAMLQRMDDFLQKADEVKTERLESPFTRSPIRRYDSRGSTCHATPHRGRPTTIREFL